MTSDSPKARVRTQKPSVESSPRAFLTKDPDFAARGALTTPGRYLLCLSAPGAAGVGTSFAAPERMRNGTTRPDEEGPRRREGEETTVPVTQRRRGDSAGEPRAGSRAQGCGRELAPRRPSIYDQYLRAVAELQNVLRSQERERLEPASYAGEALARDLLPTLDDLDEPSNMRSAARRRASRAWSPASRWYARALLGVLDKHGVAAFRRDGYSHSIPIGTRRWR